MTVDKLAFKTHIEYIVDKAANKIYRMLPNIGGPRSSKTQLLASTILHAAPVWEGALLVDTYRRTFCNPRYMRIPNNIA